MKPPPSKPWRHRCCGQAEREYRIVSVMVKRFGGAELLYELEIEE